MNTLGKLLDKSPDKVLQKPSDELVLPECLVGLELELENCPLSKLTDSQFDTLYQFWTTHNEDSLRGPDCVELVYARPLAGQNIVESLVTVEKLFKEADIQPELSFRTSVHLHLDVRDITYSQFFNLIAVYVIFEEALFRFAGEDRKKTAYCVPMSSVLSDVNRLRNLHEGEFYRQVIENFRHKKYGAVNLWAMQKFGSLEFRHMEGCVDRKRILTWINIIMCLKKYAIEHDHVPLGDWPKHISCSGGHNFLTEVFGQYAHLLDYPEIEYDMRKGIRLAQLFIYKDNIMEAVSWIKDRLWNKNTYEDVLEVCPDFWRNRSIIIMKAEQEGNLTLNLLTDLLTDN